MNLELHFLPLGRVDAIFLRYNNWTAFIDDGHSHNSDSAIAYLKQCGVVELDVYIATHRHRNHIGAAPKIIAQLHPKEIWAAGKRTKERLYSLCKNQRQKDAIGNAIFKVLPYLSSIVVDDLTIKAIGPSRLASCSSGSLTENSNSLILKVVYGSQTILLTGDTNAAKLDNKEAYNIDLLKNPHHNGNLPSSILKKIRPKTVIICNNKPCSSSYKSKLKKYGCNKVFNVCKQADGTVIFKTDGETNQTISF